MPEMNAVGDVVLTDPQAMRALADPVVLVLLDGLRREGPAAVEDLASHVHDSASAVEAHLEALATFGLVRRTVIASGGEGARWEIVGRGIFFEIPDDLEGQAAARQLSNAMLLHYSELPRRWVTEQEPSLGLDWVRAAGLFNVRVTVTPAELREIQQELERLLEPFINRDAEEIPTEAGTVRIQSYFMPGPSEDTLGR